RSAYMIFRTSIHIGGRYAEYLVPNRSARYYQYLRERSLMLWMECIGSHIHMNFRLSKALRQLFLPQLNSNASATNILNILNRFPILKVWQHRSFFLSLRPPVGLVKNFCNLDCVRTKLLLFHME